MWISEVIISVLIPRSTAFCRRLNCGEQSAMPAIDRRKPSGYFDGKRCRPRAGLPNLEIGGDLWRVASEAVCWRTFLELNRRGKMVLRYLLLLQPVHGHDYKGHMLGTIYPVFYPNQTKPHQKRIPAHSISPASTSRSTSDGAPTRLTRRGLRFGASMPNDLPLPPLCPPDLALSRNLIRLRFSAVWAHNQAVLFARCTKQFASKYPSKFPTRSSSPPDAVPIARPSPHREPLLVFSRI